MLHRPQSLQRKRGNSYIALQEVLCIAKPAVRAPTRTTLEFTKPRRIHSRELQPGVLSSSSSLGKPPPAPVWLSTSGSPGVATVSFYAFLPYQYFEQQQLHFEFSSDSPWYFIAAGDTNELL